jgi:phosphoglycerate kinase
MGKLALKDLSLNGKRVLMRVDFNVPIDKGQITDDSRLVAALPSIQYVLNHGASLILMSHLGRPKGKEEKDSLAPCALRLAQLLKKPVAMAPDCIGPEVEKMAASLKPGSVLLLENLRFHPGEEAPEKEPAFTKSLANLGDCYVNDAFGTAHRAHASTALIAKYFPGKSAMGFLMEKEISFLSPLLKNPQRPFYAIIGGAKIGTKLGVIEKLLPLVDALFIGGAMTFTFMKAKGIPIGDSLCEDPKMVQNINQDKLHFPVDLVIAKEAQTQIVLCDEGIPPGWKGMDIGPKTVALWSQELKKGATIFWNGPLGAFENPQFAKGTASIARALAKLHAKIIIGGGDSVAAIQQIGLGSKFTHLSTGGGASLEFLEFGKLPGIEALSDKI